MKSGESNGPGNVCNGVPRPLRVPSTIFLIEAFIFHTSLLRAWQYGVNIPPWSFLPRLLIWPETYSPFVHFLLLLKLRRSDLDSGGGEEGLLCFHCRNTQLTPFLLCLLYSICIFHEYSKGQILAIGSVGMECMERGSLHWHISKGLRLNNS